MGLMSVHWHWNEVGTLAWLAGKPPVNLFEKTTTTKNKTELCYQYPTSDSVKSLEEIAQNPRRKVTFISFLEFQFQYIPSIEQYCSHGVGYYGYPVHKLAWMSF